jgi:hypothetical protein
MRAWVVLLGVVALAVPAGALSDSSPYGSAGGASGTTIPRPYPGYSVVSEGFVSAKFRSRRDGNRVFYAGSAKETRAWLPFTTPRYREPDWKRYGLLAIFYRHTPGGYPGIDFVGARGSTLFVDVALFPFCGSGGGPPVPCVFSMWMVDGSSVTARSSIDGTLSNPYWGEYLLVEVDKAMLSLPSNLQRLVVSESPVPPPVPVIGPLPPPPPVP